MFEKLINSILKLMPEKIRNFYYKKESAILYIFFGGLATAVSLGSHFAVLLCFGDPGTAAATTTAATASWIITVTFAFFTNKNFVFKSKTDTKKEFFSQAAMFYAARLTTYFFEVAFLNIFIVIIGWNPYLMKFLAQIVVLLSNYLFSKLVVFQKENGAKKRPIIWIAIVVIGAVCVFVYLFIEFFMRKAAL